MTYIVLDIEATDNGTNEIIELGAIKINSKLEIIDSFRSIVKPTINPKLSPFIQNLTGITQDEVEKGEHFPNVLEKFLNWTKKDQDSSTLKFITWSKSDNHFIRTECKIHNLERPFLNHFVNVQTAVSKLLSDEPRLNLKVAVGLAGLSFEGMAHRALNDAINTAHLFIFAMEKLGSLTEILKCHERKQKKTKLGINSTAKVNVSEFQSIHYKRYSDYAKSLSIQKLKAKEDMLVRLLEKEWISESEVSSLYAIVHQKRNVISNILHLKEKDYHLMKIGLNKKQLESLLKFINNVHTIRFKVLTSKEQSIDFIREIEKIRAVARRVNKTKNLRVKREEVVESFQSLHDMIIMILESEHLNLKYQKKIQDIKKEVDSYLYSFQKIIS